MFINPNVRNPGRPTDKSSQKVSLIFGMTYEEDALPPYCVLQTGAENPQIRSHFLKHTPGTIGQFGFPPSDDPSKERGFPMGVAWSKIASETEAIFINYIENHLAPLYHDAKDEPGHRVLMKADSGPGRFSEEFQTLVILYGFYFFASLKWINCLLYSILTWKEIAIICTRCYFMK